MAIIDFVKYNGWGHAIHGHTMQDVKNYRSWLHRLIDKIKGQYRKSVMVHSIKYPRKGDTIIYKVSNGIREAKIYDVKPCGNPRDMFTLFLIMRPTKIQKGGE